MKTISRIFSMIMVVVMVFTLAVPAFAADDDYVITINNSNADSSGGHTYEAYQIFAGDLTEQGDTIRLTNIVWGKDVDGTALLNSLKANETFEVNGTNLFASCVTARDVAAEISKTSFNTATYLNRFARAAEANLKADAEPCESTENNAPYTIRIPKGDEGYYLIKDEDGSLTGQTNKDYTEFMLQVVGNVTVDHKGSIPTVSKRVSTSPTTGYTDAITVAMAKTYHYRLIGTLPSDLDNYATYYYNFKDTMSEGITFLQIDRVYLSRNKGETEIDITEGYTVSTTTDPTTKETILQVEFTDVLKELAGKVTKSPEKGTAVGTVVDPITLINTDEIIIEYSAKLNENAVIAGEGNPNKVELIYSNDPQSDSKGITLPVDPVVYTLYLNLVKLDSNGTTLLKDAQFVLYRKASDTEREYAVINDAGEIINWTPAVTGNEVPDEATALETNENGEFTLAGVGAGTYFLKETVAPNGYNLLLDDVQVTITPTVSKENGVTAIAVSTTAKFGSEVDVDTGTVTVKVENKLGNVLPSTGGIGTTMFYVVGSILTLGAIIILVTRKRMGND